jgi:hypothetical protein
MSSKRPVSFETYCKRNVKFAANKLPPEAREPFLRAFKATNCADLYGGELETYLSVIAQRLETANNKVEKFNGILFEFKKRVADL